MASSPSKSVPLAVLLLVTLAVSWGCGPPSTNAKTAKKNSAVLVVKCEVPDAEVWINSRYSRSTAEFTRGIRLKPGSYRIEIRHRDYHSRYYEFTVAAKERKVLEVDLARRFK